MEKVVNDSDECAKTNAALVSLIQRVKIETRYQHSNEALRNDVMGAMASQCARVLDFGKSSRGQFSLFRSDQIVTTDINRFDGYPDIVDDICNPKHLTHGTYDGVICLAVLEHVYDPAKAVQTLFNVLKAGGICFAYTPFLYQYHAPDSLVYQDFFRFTKDGLAYLFRDFREVTLYPVRGRYSTILNLLPGWKGRVEKMCGERLNALIDKLLSFKGDNRQVSGYYIKAIK